MGYDMYIKNPSEESLARKAKGQKDFTDACIARDEYAKSQGWERGSFKTDDETYNALQAKVEASYEDMDGGTYFRLNIWGMGRMRDTMMALDLLILDYESPDFPSNDDEVRDIVWDLKQEGNYDDMTEVERVYVKAVDDALGYTIGDTPGIPIGKLGDNSGWHVTESECKSVIGMVTAIKKNDPERYRKAHAEWAPEDATDPDARNYFDAWLEFIDEASTHGGFEVH